MISEVCTIACNTIEGVIAAVSGIVALLWSWYQHHQIKALNEPIKK